MALMSIKIIVGYSIILLILINIITFNRQKLNYLFSNRIGLLFILPFFSYVLGMLYSENLKFGIEDLALKLILLLIPLLILTSSNKFRVNRILLLLCFIIGNTTLGFISFVAGILKYNVLPVYQMMDMVLHPTYLAMYLLFACFAILYLLHFRLILKRFDKFLLLAFGINSIFIWLSLSKAGIFLWGVLMLGIIIYQLKNNYTKSKEVIISILAGILILCLVAIHYFRGFTERITYSYTSVKTLFEDSSENKESTRESSMLRLLIWEQAVELIKEQPILGTGTGDIKDELIIKYKKANITEAWEKRLNVHNQYLQIFATLGLIGFFLFLIVFLLPTYWAFKEKNYLYVGFMIIVGFNFMFESLLEKQDGVIFYSLLNAFTFFFFRPGNDPAQS
jgi:O-antigen ligase